MVSATTNDTLSEQFFQRAVARAGQRMPMRQSFELSLLGAMLSAIFKSGPDVEVLLLTRPYALKIDPVLYADLANIDSQRILAGHHITGRLVHKDLFEDFETIFKDITPILEERSVNSAPYSPIRDAAIIAARSLSFIKTQKSSRDGIHDAGLPALHYSNPYTHLSLAVLLLREIVRNSWNDNPLVNIWNGETGNSVLEDIELFTDRVIEKYPNGLMPHQATPIQKTMLLEDMTAIFETTERVLFNHNKITYASREHVHGLMIVRELIAPYIAKDTCAPLNEPSATILEIDKWAPAIAARRARDDSRHHNL